MKSLKNTIAKNLVAFLFSHFLVFSAMNLHAQEKHTVRSGDTLFGISNTYDVTVNDIRKWNDINGNSISVDQVLIVSGPDQSRGSSESTLSQEGTIHTVEAGETLFRISRQYNVSVNDIREWNNLSNDDLKIGEELKIHKDAVTENSSPVVENISESSSLSTRPSQDYHEVARGETLYRISQQYNMSVSELQKLNNIEGSQLNIGQFLIVHASKPAPSGISKATVTEVVEAEEGEAAGADISTPLGAFESHILGENETVEGLITHYRMDQEEFSSLNPHFKLDEIKAGDSLKVLKPVTSGRKNPYRVGSNLEEGGDISVTVYDPQQKGSTTTSGDLYNPGHLTAAHASLRLGKVIYIENPANEKGIFVQINDRVTGNYVKLSSAAFQSLGFEKSDELAARIYEEMPQ
ncbi:MAG: LysM peptidoglycan-binding domain-containing protein [Balneolales bacterium]